MQLFPSLFLYTQRTIATLLRSALEEKEGSQGFLIDGFPRELEQAHIFEEEVGSSTNRQHAPSVCVSTYAGPVPSHGLSGGPLSTFDCPHVTAWCVDLTPICTLHSHTL